MKTIIFIVVHDLSFLKNLNYSS